ncbi:MAG: pseudouridine-5'-phosphate glycosidase [Anaerolineales bacterium]|nr:pseudouridine-5'-phosphate glycosidase [Anaerolineales bacterium]
MPYPLPTLSAEVRDALSARRPLVALESTVITHGLPWPQNLELARQLEATVRAGGACPATIAVLQGEVKVGLSDAELAHLAQAPGVIKVSRRDYGVAVAQKRDGGTTVAGTMIAAQWAGIRVFATGGIGGVHRGLGEARLDISADLPELARTPVVVVCAGAKAILDLPATLEWLETHGVPVIGYGTDEFPAFYSRTSGLRLAARADTAAEAALLVKAMWDLDLNSGALLCVPVPEADARPAAEMNTAIEQALREAAAAGVRGSAVTPYLLARMAALTEGHSLAANLALLKNNARVAAEVAGELGKLHLKT